MIDSVFRERRLVDHDATTVIFLAGPQVLVLEALAGLLAEEADFDVLAPAASCAEARHIIGVRTPDVAVVQTTSRDGDVTGGGLIDASKTVKVVRDCCPDTAVLAMTSGDLTPHTGTAIGGDGAVSLCRPRRDFVRAIRAAVGRPEPVHPKVRRRASDDQLTNREIDVLRLAATGRSNRQIADALYLSEHTVLGYLKSLSAKLGVHSKLQAVVLGLMRDLVPFPDEADLGAAGESVDTSRV